MELYNGDCLGIMKNIPDKSIDMILCDLPYGTTACKWDTIIPFEPLWEQYNRIIKDNGAIVLFGSEPFSSHLRMSNLKMYKYDWVWVKSRVGNIFNCKNSPLKIYENIVVFSKGNIANGSKLLMKYFPQNVSECNIVRKNTKRKTEIIGNRKSREGDYSQTKTGYPKNILYFNNKKSNLHPTQKPVELLEYLIKTYTNEGELVLDNCMGSGSTGVACINTNREFIGIEKDSKYFKIAEERLRSTAFIV